MPPSQSDISEAKRNYEPPTVEEGSPLIPGQESELAPGVVGYAIEQDGRILIPLIIAHEEGSGAVGKFLDSLSERCVITCVTSSRLRGMLTRRDWMVVSESCEFGEVDIWKRGN